MITALLKSLFEYKAWANQDLLIKLCDIDVEKYPKQRKLAIRLLNHTHVVDRIFQAHLTGVTHHYDASNTPETPTMDELQAAIQTTDAWYVDYVCTLPVESMTERIAFVFTDGQNGCMNREEILAHLITHGGYHRGAIGRILTEVGLTPPRDGLTGFLHQTEPERRERG